MANHCYNGTDLMLLLSYPWPTHSAPGFCRHYDLLSKLEQSSPRSETPRTASSTCHPRSALTSFPKDQSSTSSWTWFFTYTSQLLVLSHHKLGLLTHQPLTRSLKPVLWPLLLRVFLLLVMSWFMWTPDAEGGWDSFQRAVQITWAFLPSF